VWCSSRVSGYREKYAQPHAIGGRRGAPRVRCVLLGALLRWTRGPPLRTFARRWAVVPARRAPVRCCGAITGCWRVRRVTRLLPVLLRQRLPDLAGAGWRSEPPRGAGAAARRGRAIAAGDRGRGCRRVLVLDDLHWADRARWTLCCAMWRGLRRTPGCSFLARLPRPLGGVGNGITQLAESASARCRGDSI
jgi:hypothetical protein